jgi:hypothetical protein
VLPSPQVERTALDPPKPLSPKEARGSHGAGGAPTSLIRAALGQDPVGTSSRSEPTESSKSTPPSPQSYGLRAAGWSQHGEGSFVPQSKEPPRQCSQVPESLWDNPDFIQARFHIEWFITTVVDTKVDRENIQVLYSSLKNTSVQINKSARQPTLLHLLDMDLILSFCRHWLKTLDTRINS